LQMWLLARSSLGRGSLQIIHNTLFNIYYDIYYNPYHRADMIKNNSTETAPNGKISPNRHVTLTLTLTLTLLLTLPLPTIELT
jgi:hypothetical protein